MSKSRTPQRQILDYLIDIKSDVAGIKEHLKTLNGHILNHEDRINFLEKDNIRNKITWAKLFGMFTASGAIGGFIVTLVLKFI